MGGGGDLQKARRRGNSLGEEEKLTVYRRHRQRIAHPLPILGVAACAYVVSTRVHRESHFQKSLAWFAHPYTPGRTRRSVRPEHPQGCVPSDDMDPRQCPPAPRHALTSEALGTNKQNV